MKVKCYINGIGCVSAQDSTNNAVFLDNALPLTQNITKAFKPNYKAYIPPAMIRRMSAGVKMGVVASAIALKESKQENPEGIITGTGMGCTNDSDKFLKSLIDNKEEYLTPTSFIQSTHNTVGAQIALGLQCKSYNVTYVHDANSLPTAFIDAMLMIQGEGIEYLLVGGVDENNKFTNDALQLIGDIKKEELIDSLFEVQSEGTILSEGAQFFVLENVKKENTYAQLLDVITYNTLNAEKVEGKLHLFLKNNAMEIEDIDAVFLGENGDIRYDGVYHDLKNKIFQHKIQLAFKHLSGEFNTAIGFAIWAASLVLKTQSIPNILRRNKVEKNAVKNILIYNQYKGKNHSFTLLSTC